MKSQKTVQQQLHVQHKQQRYQHKTKNIIQKETGSSTGYTNDNTQHKAIEKTTIIGNITSKYVNKKQRSQSMTDTIKNSTTDESNKNN